MKTACIIYRGYEIKAWREECMGGWDLLYYSIFRVEDGWELTSGFEDSEEKVEDWIEMAKTLVDEEIEDPGAHDRYLEAVTRLR